MAMEALGRLINVMPIASGTAISLKTCTGITFVVTGNDTFTLTVSTVFGSGFTTPPTTAIGGGLVRNYYTTTTAGTAAWSKTALASGSYVNAVTIASGVAAFAVYPVDLAGSTNYVYIKCTAGSAGLVTAIPHDLTEQRGPANLPILSA